MTALDESDDMLRDDSLPGETLSVPAVCPGELEEDNVSDLMKCSVVFLQLCRGSRLEVAPLEGTLIGWFGVLSLVSL